MIYMNKICCKSLVYQRFYSIFVHDKTARKPSFSMDALMAKIAILECSLADKDAVIAHKESVIADKESVIADKESAIEADQRL